MSNLLVELLVEELPPKALKKLAEAFSNTLAYELKNDSLLEQSSVVTSYASPRRLAVHISEVLDAAPAKRVRKKLMPSSIAFDADGNHSDALKKRLLKEGYDTFIEGPSYHLERVVEGGTENLYLDYEEGGMSLGFNLDFAIKVALSKLPIPKVMGYQLQDGWETVQFVRPAHKLVALHGSDVINITVLGLDSGRETQGHRFEATVNPIVIRDADSYAEQLKTEGAVVASFEERRAEIVRQLNAAAAKENLKPIEDDALLDEVTALVERPNVLLGQFEKEFLEVPQECLILTMKANQKYFPLLDKNDKLTNKFLIVSNISPSDPSAVIGGNERVVRPRLADAKFFFNQDRKKTLESRIAGLDKVIYHNKLGSQGERTSRVQQIAFSIARLINNNETFLSKVYLAAGLTKTDLLTDMVGEFPELQGIMGRYYAQHEKLDDDISYAIEDHYKPRFSGDELPRNQVGVCIALADKLETLAGMFFIGEKPTGDKDPYALRRHALGVIRILIESKLNIRLEQLWSEVNSVYSGAFPQLNFDHIKTKQEVTNFILDRLTGYLKEQGYSALEVEALISVYPITFTEIPTRIEAVRNFSQLPEAPTLAAANKRVGNILKKAEGEVKAEVKTGLLQEPAEIALNSALSKVKPEADKLFESGDYTASLKALAALKAPVDDFFDNVMVNAENIDLRNNRLALLAQLHAAMNRVADLSKLAG